jgi:hypothetical protein
MAKDTKTKAELYAEAERLYVQERMNMDDIAVKMGRDPRSIRTWAAEGDWVGRRARFTEATGKTHEKLYVLIQKLTDKAIQSAEDGEEPSQSQLYFIAKMAPLLLKLQTYEETADKPAEETAPKKQGLTEDTIRRIEEEILGLKR